MTIKAESKEDEVYNEWANMMSDNRNKFELMLKRYCNYKSDGFIRDFATKKGRILVQSVKKLFDLVYRYGYELRRDLFVSIYEYNSLQDDRGLPDYNDYKMIDKVVFDIDTDNLEKGHAVAENIIRQLKREFWNGNIKMGKVQAFFTGGRGFHVYYIPSSPYLSNTKKMDLCRKVYKELGKPDCIDTGLFGDVSRDIRIPYTIHPKTLGQMIPVDLFGDTTESIVEESKRIKSPQLPLFRGKIV